MKVKSEKGSISIYVLSACMLVLAVLMSVFMRNQTKLNTQRKQQKIIEQQYSDDSKIDEIYNKAISVKDEGYISDGLVLYLDGVNNTGNGHDSTATTWKDLSGNNNDATLNNFEYTSTSGWDDNCMILDGSDDYAQVGDSESMKPVAQTVEIVFNRTGISNNNSSNRGIVFVRWMGYTFETNAINNNKFSVSYGRNNGYLDSESLLDINSKYLLTSTHSNNKSKMYINSIYENEQEKTPATYESIYTNNCTYIGKYNDSTHFKGNIYAIRMYNRALAEQEIKHNYEVDKERFGL